MLDELATVIPKRLWLKKMDEKGGTSITFEGTAATIDDVSAFMSALKTSKHFAAVELKRTNATGGKQGGTTVRLVDFMITASVTYGGVPVAGAAPAGAKPPAGAAPGTPVQR
jgi:type IV pilus assembly protein PilN